MLFGEDEQQKHDAFRRKLVEPEHFLRFSFYARSMRKLPESAWNGGPEWCKSLSSEAEAYLTKLDRLHFEKPLTAIKIAAIVAASAPVQYVLGQQAKKRVCEWLNREDCPSHARIELGMSIRELWPITYNGMEGLDEALLELLTCESAVDPEYVVSVCRPIWDRFGGNPTNVLSSVDDPAKLLVIGRNLKTIEPELCKSMFNTYLFSGRLNHCGFEASEEELRRVADEFFQLEGIIPSTDLTKSGFRYFSLSQWGYLDAEWYPVILERLHAAACACDNLVQAADWNRAVAMNADPQSSVFSRSMEAFTQYVQSYTLLPTESPYKLQNFVRFLTKTLEIAYGERVVSGRNIALPPNPSHPIVDVTKRAYWGMVTWASDLPSAAVLSLLVEAVEHTDNPLAEDAETRLAEIFEVRASQDTEGAASALGRLWCYDWYSGVKESRKSRCLGLVRHLTAILETISSEAAKRAKDLGRNPAWDR